MEMNSMKKKTIKEQQGHSMPPDYISTYMLWPSQIGILPWYILSVTYSLLSVHHTWDSKGWKRLRVAKVDQNWGKTFNSQDISWWSTFTESLSFPQTQPNLAFCSPMFWGREKGGPRRKDTSFRVIQILVHIWLYQLFVVQIWASYFNSLYVSFFTCKMGMRLFKALNALAYVWQTSTLSDQVKNLEE